MMAARNALLAARIRSAELVQIGSVHPINVIDQGGVRMRNRN